VAITPESEHGWFADGAVRGWLRTGQGRLAGIRPIGLSARPPIARPAARLLHSLRGVLDTGHGRSPHKLADGLEPASHMAHLFSTQRH
jgi:hypothetical protein